MRKGLTIVSVLALVLVGFLALANPVAACEGDFEFKKEACPICPDFENNAVPLGTNVAWMLTITVTADEDMHNLYIKDRLGGELEVDPSPAPYWDYGLCLITTKGKTAKVFIDWYIPFLGEGSTATLTMRISTDVNPGGQQEYTTPGCYELNSGAVLKYYDCDGNKYVAYSEVIPITVV